MASKNLPIIKKSITLQAKARNDHTSRQKLLPNLLICEVKKHSAKLTGKKF